MRPATRRAIFPGLFTIAVTASLAVAIAGSAQVPVGPAVGSLAGASRLSGSIRSHWEHGCGLSFQFSQATTDLTLEVRGGRATMVARGTYGSETGAHDGSSSTIYGEAIEATLTGRAITAPDTLTITFDAADLATSRWVGPGSLPVGPSARVPFAHTLTCTRQSRPVLAATDPWSAHGVPTMVVHCAFDDGVPTELGLFLRGEVVLGAGAGIEATTSEMGIGETTTLRAP